MGLLALAALALITGTLRGVGPLRSAQHVGADAMRPFAITAHRVASPFVDTYDYFSGLFHAKSEVTQLHKDLERARQAQAQNATAQSDNADLRRMLHYHGLPTFPRNYDGIDTAVMTHGWPEPASLITVAVGKDDGIRYGDPVVSVDGYLVGIVTDASDTTARVTLLTDPAAAVSARDARTTAEGLVHASFDASGSINVYLDRVPKADEVKNGDLIMTAGWRYQDIESNYPRGIPIGRVTSVSRRDIDQTQQIQLKLFADLGALENVTVLIPKRRSAAG
jgi:rod shape-determining protein MreC